MASESIVTSETLVNGNGVVLFVLLHTKEVKRLVWHTWSDVTEKLVS